jgi:predicted nucleic acid-binding protein
MRRSSPVCCDANLVVLAVTRATDPAIYDLWERWRSEHRRILAPVLLHYEVTNALHRLCLAGELSRGRAAEALEVALAMPITLETGVDLHHRALEIAALFNRPATYDAHYLAVAERHGAEFWTADERLYNAVHAHLSWIHLVVI